MNHENPESSPLTQAINLMPTEMRCIDETVEGTSLTADDIRLVALEPKIETALHAMRGDAIRVGDEKASKEEITEFAKLLKNKATQYSQLVDTLENILTEA